MALTNKSDIKITNGSTSVTFSPQTYKINYESLSGEDSGRTDDGTMHITWILRKMLKLDITLPPHKVSDTTYNKVLKLVQGQTYTIEYWDYIDGTWQTKDMYTANSSAEWYSGVVSNGIIQGASFTAVDLNN